MSQIERVRVTELERDQTTFLQHLNEQAIYQHLSERLDVFERIEHIVTNMNRYQSAEQRLDSLLRAFVYSAPATQQGAIYLNTGHKGRFVVGAVFPRQPQQVGTTVEATDGYVDAVAEVQSATLLDDTLGDAIARHPRHTTGLREARSALVIPFVAGGRTAGVLTLENCDRTNAFAQQELDFCIWLSQYTTMAVDLARATIAHSDAHETQLPEEGTPGIDKLVLGIAHELNGPLTAVVSFAELLLSQDVPPHIAKDLATISRQARQGVPVVRQLLDYMPLETHERTHLDVNNLIRQLARFRLYARQKSTLDIQLSLVEPAPTILGNAQQFQQMLLNLIDNAEQACAAAGLACQVCISTERIEDRVQISVQDNGPGIAPEVRDRIFEPFTTTKLHDRAMGMGLAVCRQIVSQHNGKISFKDAPERGTTFTVEFTVDNHPQKPADNPVQHRTDPATFPARILVVDDETSITRLLYKVLTLNGHTVDSAATGHQALNKIQQNRYDIVFLDLKIPEVPGQRIYDWIKKHQADLLSRTVILTGDTLNDDTMHFLDREQAVRLLKPFELGELRSLMQCIWPT